MRPERTLRPMQLEPYLCFYGRCEEALEFYKGVFGGSYEAQRNSDMPPGMMEMPDDWKNKIMHSTFKGPGFQFMASDGRPPARKVNTDEGNISLSIGASTDDEGARIHKALSEGGTVDMPFEEAFWGGKFGMVTDKFGTEWMIVAGQMG